jgi:hypothetical protein
MTAFVKVGNQYINLDQIAYTNWEGDHARYTVTFISDTVLVLPPGYGTTLETAISDDASTYAKTQEAAHVLAIGTIYKETH